MYKRIPPSRYCLALGEERRALEFIDLRIWIGEIAFFMRVERRSPLSTYFASQFETNFIVKCIECSGRFSHMKRSCTGASRVGFTRQAVYRR